MAATLPAEWTQVLEKIQESLAQAIREAEASQANQESTALPLADHREIVHATGVSRREGLVGKYQALQTMGLEVDQLLAQGEEDLRRQGEAAAALRTRLDAWTRRAIG